MSNSQVSPSIIDFRAAFDAMAQGALLFDADDQLVMSNKAAENILGQNMPLVRSEGWSACAMLLDSRRTNGPTANDARAQALRQTEAVRFHAMLGGAYTPCWAVMVQSASGMKCTMITIDRPDWTELNELMSRFREEAGQAIDSTAGHADLILQLINKRPAGITIEKLSAQITGFAEIIATHMYRMQLLVELLQRLEVIRTGELPERVNRYRRKVALADFLEELVEELGSKRLTDGPTKIDIRERIVLKVPSKLYVGASTSHLTQVIHDLLRNAVMYSPPDSPITIQAKRAPQGTTIQIDVMDQGYGIRAKEADKVFALFQRARQPQIIREFGYGISLYLAKAEVEAMAGRIWYESEEGVGSTFSIKLPVWVDPETEQKS